MKPVGEGISHDEIVNLEPVGPAYMAAHKVRIGVKAISFIDSVGRVAIQFQRGVSSSGESDFCICVQETKPITERCSMGHYHEIAKQKTEWGHIQLSWGQAEQLIEWFKQGDWRQVREMRKKLKNNS